MFMVSITTNQGSLWVGDARLMLVSIVQTVLVTVTVMLLTEKEYSGYSPEEQVEH